MVVDELYEKGELEEGINIDFIHGETQYVGDSDFKEFTEWGLTINVGETDIKGYVDALIVNFKREDYQTFFSDELKYEIEQVPSNNWDENKIKNLLIKHKDRIEDIISQFCEEHESQNMN